MALTVTDTPAKTVANLSGSPLYTSRWVAAHNPIVFKIASSLFPIPTGQTALTYDSVSKSPRGYCNFTYSNFGGFDAGVLVQGMFVRVTGTVYSGVFKVLQFNPVDNFVELQVGFSATDSGTIQKSYTNYAVELKIFAGLPIGHKWQAFKPEVEMETMRAIPNPAGVAIFDIQEAVKQKVSTKNDLALASLPNDINLWTGFRVEFREIYDSPQGVTGEVAGITAATNEGGKQKFTIDTNLGLVAGDFVVLQNFDSDEYNGAVIKVISSNTNSAVLDIPFSAGLSLTGYETMQRYITDISPIDLPFTSEGNQYYAANAKLPAASRFGSNLAEYLNTSDFTNPIKWLSGFEGKQTFADYYDDVAAIIDKTLLDSLAPTEELRIEIKEFDRNGVQGATQYLSIPNQAEGIYRLPFLRGIPPFIYELPANAVLSHLFFSRPAQFKYPPLVPDTGISPTIEIEGTVQSARGDNYAYDANGQTAVRNREVQPGRCLRVDSNNTGAFWSFSAIGLTGTMTAVVGWYKDSVGTVTLNKTLTGSDPEIDNTNKRFIPQLNYKYHDLRIFEDGVLFGRYFLEQKFSSVLIDGSGNGAHRQGNNTPNPSNLWTTDNVNFSYANGDNGGLGYTPAVGTENLDSVTIPAGEIIPGITASLDAAGGFLKFRGKCAIDGKLTNSPTAFFANNATLTFIDKTPYTRPSVVTVHAGTATGSYNPATGVFTVGSAGTIEALEVDGNIVYLVSGTSNAYRWKKGNNQYLFFSSAATWVTTDNHAFLQARGGNMIKDVFFPNAQIALASNIVLAPLFKITYVVTPYDLFLTSIFKQFEFGRQINNTGFVFRLNFGNPQVQVLTSLGSRTLGIPVGIKFNEQNTFTVERTDVKTIVFTVTNSAGTGTVSVDISEDTGTDLTSHAFAIENLLMRNGLSATVLRAYAFAKIDSIVIEQNGVVTNSYTPAISNLDLVGSNNIGTYNKVNLNVPSALDASGNSTGFDVAGNALPAGAGFRLQNFGNSVKVNPNNAPALRYPFGIDSTEELTFAQVIQSVNGLGVDRYLKGGNVAGATSKEDYILLNTATATAEDVTKVENFENR